MVDIRQSESGGGMVQLPGGLLRDGRLARLVRFRTLTGKLEETLHSLSGGAVSPGFVTNILSIAVESLDGTPVTAQEISDMSVGDRQFLMLRLSVWLGEDHRWIRGRCEACTKFYDIGFRRSELPVKEAGEGYPNVSVEIRNNPVVFRLPSGRDQEATSSDQPEEDSIRDLLRRCMVSTDENGDVTDFIHSLEEEEIGIIDGVMESIAPQVATEIITTCPECGARSVVKLDPYAMATPDEGNLYEEVHHLASHYHWSEEDILALTRDRRRLYIDLIDKEKGLHS